MKRILVPVDFSGNSLKALRMAILFANRMGTNLRVLHVKKSERIEIPFHIEGLEDNNACDPEICVDKLVEYYSQDYQVEGGIFDFKIREGNIYKEIVNQAKYNDCYLIVMGTYGASGFQEFFIGSNACKVVTRSPCPVVTIHKDEKKRINRVVMPIDLSDESRLKIPFVCDLARYFGAEVHILGVHEMTDDDNVYKIEAFIHQAEINLQKKGLNAIKAFRKGENNTTTTLDYAREVHADVIVVMREQVEMTFSFFFGSYAEKMVHESEIPVIVVPN